MTSGNPLPESRSAKGGEDVNWGVWVSLSRQSYQHYQAHYDQPDLNTAYFGWICNYLPWDSRTYALATSVHPLDKGHRPCLTLPCMKPIMN